MTTPYLREFMDQVLQPPDAISNKYIMLVRNVFAYAQYDTEAHDIQTILTVPDRERFAMHEVQDIRDTLRRMIIARNLMMPRWDYLAHVYYYLLNCYLGMEKYMKTDSFKKGLLKAYIEKHRPNELIKARADQDLANLQERFPKNKYEDIYNLPTSTVTQRILDLIKTHKPDELQVYIGAESLVDGLITAIQGLANVLENNGMHYEVVRDIESSMHDWRLCCESLVPLKNNTSGDKYQIEFNSNYKQGLAAGITADESNISIEWGDGDNRLFTLNSDGTLRTCLAYNIGGIGQQFINAYHDNIGKIDTPHDITCQNLIKYEWQQTIMNPDQYAPSGVVYTQPQFAQFQEDWMKQKIKAEIPQELEEVESVAPNEDNLVPDEASPLVERQIVPEEESKTDYTIYALAAAAIGLFLFRR